MAITERFVDAMGSWRRLTEAAETAVLDNVAATTPWLAPALPAAISFGHMRDYLGFDDWLAIVGAVCIEFLGLAAVHTSFQLWSYNDTKRESDQSAPVRWAIAAGGAYLLVILLVNGGLEAAAVGTWTVMAAAGIMAKALLSLLSVVAAFILAIRAQHSRRLALQAQDKQARRDAQELGQLRKFVPELKETKRLLRESRQEVAALKQQVQAAEQVGARLERADAAMKRLQQQLDTAAKERDDLRQLWDALPPTYKAAVSYHLDLGTTRDVAETYGTSKATVSRVHKTLFGVNGAGD